MIIEPYHWQSVAITEITSASVDTVRLRLEKPRNYSYVAGQYTVVRIISGLGQRVIRQYSLSSPPAAPWLELTIQKEKGGEVSQWLEQIAKPGVKIEISQPFGNLLPPEPSRAAVFIAGRVGIAPFMSMIRSATITENFTIFYCINRRGQICYREELEAYDSHFFTSESGVRLTSADLASILPSRPLIYICGSRDFVETMQVLTHQVGIPPEDIRRESFTL